MSAPPFWDRPEIGAWTCWNLLPFLGNMREFEGSTNQRRAGKTFEKSEINILFPVPFEFNSMPEKLNPYDVIS